MADNQLRNAQSMGEVEPSTEQPPASITSLPTEVLMKVFGHLMWDDRPDWRGWAEYSSQRGYTEKTKFLHGIPDQSDMKNLRLTCRTFESLASSLLFRRVRLSYYRASLHNFVRIAFSPTLRVHVKRLQWEETAAAVMFDNHPRKIKTRTVDGRLELNVAHQTLWTKAWEQLCWNQDLTGLDAASTSQGVGEGNEVQPSEVVFGPAQKSPVDAVISLLGAALQNMPNLSVLYCIPLYDQSGHASTRGMYRSRHIPSLLPDEFLEVDFTNPVPDRFFNLHKTAFFSGCHQPEMFNDNFFRFIAPALSRIAPSPTKLKTLLLIDEITAAGEPGSLGGSQGCVRRFREIHPAALENLTSIWLALPFSAMYTPRRHTFGLSEGMLTAKSGAYLRAVIGCLESATHLKTLALCELDEPKDARHLHRNGGKPWEQKAHFFDLLVWGDHPGGGGIYARPHANLTPGRRWKSLEALFLSGVYFSQLSLLRFLAMHQQTINHLGLTCAPLEFRTARALSQLPLLNLKKIQVMPPLWTADVNPRVVEPESHNYRSVFVRDVERIPADKLLAYINNYKPARGGDAVPEKTKWAVLGLPEPTPVSPAYASPFIIVNGMELVPARRLEPKPNYSSANFFIRTRRHPGRVLGYMHQITLEKETLAQTITHERRRELQDKKQERCFDRDSKEDRECWERARTEDKVALDFRDWIPERDDQYHHPGFLGPEIGELPRVPQNGCNFTKEELDCAFAGLRSPGDETVLLEDERGRVKKYEGNGTPGDLDAAPTSTSAGTKMETSETTTPSKGTPETTMPSTSTSTLGEDNATPSVITHIHWTNGRAGLGHNDPDMPEVFREEAATLARLLQLPRGEDGIRDLWREIKGPFRR